jgi:hypothetical protein
MEFQVFFAKVAAVSHNVFKLDSSKHINELSVNFEKTLKDSEMDPFVGKKEAALVGNLCKLMYNSEDDLPPIEMKLVKRLECFLAANQRASAVPEPILDIQFCKVEVLKWSFLEKLFSVSNGRLFNVVMSATLEQQMDVRVWLLSPTSNNIGVFKLPSLEIKKRRLETSLEEDAAAEKQFDASLKHPSKRAKVN